MLPTSSSTLTHDTASGLSFLTRAPRRGPARGLLILLHGVGGNEQNLLPLAHALPDDLLVVLARGPIALSAAQYAWFPVLFTPDGPRINAAQAEAARVRLLALIASLQATHGLPAARTLVAGFSQGGIMSASAALTQPDALAGFAILSGRILPEIAPLTAPAAALAHLQAFVAHGEDDHTLPAFWADRAEARLDELGVATTARRYPGGHEIGASMRDDFVRWADALLAPEAVRLSLGNDALELATGETRLTLAAGVSQVQARHFRHSPPTPGELEAAIQDIEDALEPAAHRFASRTLLSNEPWFAELARFAGTTGDALDRDSVERSFNRLAALAEGHPLALDPLPPEPLFAARLLLLRELMHHLDFTVLRAG